jgi:RNA polymerase sigma-70 factor (ECF subfamily)
VLYEGIEEPPIPAADPATPDPTRRPPADVRRLHVVGPDSYANWDEIYVDNVVRVYRLLYAKVANRADAEDLTTEVFLAAYGPLRTEASRGEVRAYLAATCRTALARYWRTRLGVEVTHIEADVPAEQLDDDPQPSAAPHRIQQLLAALPERHRRILQLRFLEARSVRETAHEMGISVANAKVLQHRALRMAARVGQEGER